MSAVPDTIETGPRLEVVPSVVATTGIEFSPTLSNIAKALILAQGNMGEIRKASTNPHFRSKYADLPTCVDAVQHALQAAGIALLQAATSNADASVVFVETMFLHESGEWVRSRLGLRPVKTDPQGSGSAITYGRRYTLLAMCGVAPEEDDDGNAASRKARTPQPSEGREPLHEGRSGERDGTPPRSQTEVPNESAHSPDKDKPGSCIPKMQEKLAQQINALGLTEGQIQFAFQTATKDRIHGPDAALKDLSWNEGVALGKLLASTPCALCGAKVLAGADHVWNEYGMPCEADTSEAAVAAVAEARLRERGSADEVELPL